MFMLKSSLNFQFLLISLVPSEDMNYNLLAISFDLEQICATNQLLQKSDQLNET